jgi:hypothetical protein
MRDTSTASIDMRDMSTASIDDDYRCKSNHLREEYVGDASEFDGFV